jgi:hypothetical protein
MCTLGARRDGGGKPARDSYLDFGHLLKINDLNHPLTLTLSPRGEG